MLSPSTPLRVLVTGGHGFLGRALCRQARAATAWRILAPTRAECDLLDAAAVARLFRELQPDVVFHLAAEVGGIGANRAQPGWFFYANLQMGLNVIEAARVSGVQKFIQTGTVCGYPQAPPVPFREDDLWNGYPEPTNAPYGIAKKALLVMLQSYREQYGFPGIYLLPTNLYGPGDNFDPATSHVIPALIAKCAEALRERRPELVVWGTGRASREFLYVDDCAEGLLLAATRYDGTPPVNLGSGQEVRISELANLIAELMGYGGQIVWDTTRPDGQPRRCLDTTRAWREFGFRARTEFREGLRQTIHWFLQER